MHEIVLGIQIAQLWKLLRQQRGMTAWDSTYLLRGLQKPGFYIMLYLLDHLDWVSNER